MLAWKQNGSVWEPTQSLSLSDRGFRYGMSVFETITVIAGRPLFLDEHLERLRRAVASCGAELSPLPEFEFSRLWTGLLRFYVSAGPGAPGDAFLGNVHAIFDAAEVGWNLPSLRVASCAAPYVPRPGGWKSGNYWQNVDALEGASRAGCGEALVFNPAGMLVGAAVANIFLQLDGLWMTPALETGARDGAVRSWVMTQFGVGEGILDSRDVARCSAAFLTNSRVGIRSVCELDGRPLLDLVADIQQSYFDDIFAA